MMKNLDDQYYFCFSDCAAQVKLRGLLSSTRPFLHLQLHPLCPHQPAKEELQQRSMTA
jgi:hypothetical protein